MLLDGTTSGKGRENRVKIGVGDPIAKHAKVDLIWVAGRSPALVPQNFEMTTLHYLAIFL